MANYIAILTYKDAPCIRWNLDNADFWRSIEDSQVLVLNQGGSPDFLSDLPRPNLTVINSPFNRQIVHGRQRLIDLLYARLKSNDTVILLDHDTKMTDGRWFKRLLEPFNQSTVGVVGAYVPANIEEDEAGNWMFVQARLPGHVDVAAACITAYRADLFLEGCEFDPIYAPMWEEDADLCLQARAKGWQVWGVADVGMFHEIGHKEPDLLSERNRHFLQRKWQGKGLIRMERLALQKESS
jgi:GT2 family glycosyltransferase